MLQSIDERSLKNIVIPLIKDGTAKEVEGAGFICRAGPIDSYPVEHTIKFYTLYGKVIRAGLNEASGETNYKFIGGEDLEMFVNRYLNRLQREEILNPSTETVEEWRQKNDNTQVLTSRAQPQI